MWTCSCVQHHHHRHLHSAHNPHACSRNVCVCIDYVKLHALSQRFQSVLDSIRSVHEPSALPVRHKPHSHSAISDVMNEYNHALTPPCHIVPESVILDRSVCHCYTMKGEGSRRINGDGAETTTTPTTVSSSVHSDQCTLALITHSFREVKLWLHTRATHSLHTFRSHILDIFADTRCIGKLKHMQLRHNWISSTSTLTPSSLPSPSPSPSPSSRLLIPSVLSDDGDLMNEIRTLKVLSMI